MAIKVSDTAPPAKGQPNNEPQPTGGVMVLSPDQFARIEELLLPGYELAKLMLTQYQPEAEVPAEVPEVTTE